MRVRICRDMWGTAGVGCGGVIALCRVRRGWVSSIGAWPGIFL